MVKKICYYSVTCDSCGKVSDKRYYNATGFRSYIDFIRLDGWAIAKNRLTCYCPECAPYYRHAGIRAGEVVTPMIKAKRAQKDFFDSVSKTRESV